MDNNFGGYKINDLPDQLATTVCLCPVFNPSTGQWALMKTLNERLSQAVVSASNATPIDPSKGLVVTETLAENTTVGAPSGTIPVGTVLSILFTQDGTGGRTVAWNAIFKFTTYAWTNTGNTANKKAFATFVFDGTQWQSMVPAANTWF